MSPPAHDLTNFWKTGGDIRAWTAGHVARALDEALNGLQVEDPVMESWQTIVEIARKERAS